MSTNICSRKPFQEKTQLESKVALFSFVWNGNDAGTKEKTLYMELLEIYGPWDATKHLSLSIHT